MKLFYRNRYCPPNPTTPRGANAEVWRMLMDVHLRLGILEGRQTVMAGISVAMLVVVITLVAR